MTFDVRLRAYEPAGDPVGFLPEPSKLEVSFVHNDAGALTLEYSDLAAGGALLQRGLAQGLEVAVEVAKSDGSWVEPRGGRFVLVARDRDQADQTRTGKLTLPSYGWLLSKARNLDLDELLPEDADQAGKRPFYSESAGVIVGTLLDENAGRGGVPVGKSWTSVEDSDGAAWQYVATLYYELGIELSTVLDNLAAQGMCDWRTLGRDLALYNPDTVCAPDVSDTVQLRLGQDVADAPSSESIEEVVSLVLLRGDGGLTLIEDNPGAPTPWGGWEGFISQGGVTEEATARQLVQSELERAARVRGQYTRKLVLTGSRAHLPMVDYGPGSWITAPTTGTGERVRVQQVTLTKEGDDVGGSVVLNDRILDAELRRAKKVQGVTGGATGGGTGGRPAPEGPDRRQPAAPTGLVVDSDTYLDSDGAARGILSMAWGEVTTATDGTLLEVASYDIAVRENTTGAPWSVVLSSDDTETTYSPVDVGAELGVKVRARGKYATTPGAWSDVTVATVATDVTPPPVPSAPVLSSKLGTITVTWDGETSTGSTMPRDFDHIDVVEDGVVVGDIRPSSGVSTLVRAFPDVSSHTYELRAIDRSGNASDDSDSASITTVRIEGPDIEANSVTANELDIGSARIAILDVDVIDGDMIQSDAIDGKVITGATVRTAETGDRIEMSGSQILCWYGGSLAAGMAPQGIEIQQDGVLRVESSGSNLAVLQSGGIDFNGGIGSLRYNDGFIALDASDRARVMATNHVQLNTGSGSGLGQLTLKQDRVEIISSGGGNDIVMRVRDAQADQRSIFVLDEDYSYWRSYSGDGSTLRSNLSMDTAYITLDHRNSSGEITSMISVGSADVELYGVGTGSGPNLVLDGVDIRTNSSSLRYKRDVEPLNLDEFSSKEILDVLSPIVYRDTQQYEKDQDARFYPGIIAEELHDAGFELWVWYDQQNRPDSVAYERLVTLLAEVVRRQDARITALEEGATP